jgi:hypothetical protein
MAIAFRREDRVTHVKLSDAKATAVYASADLRAFIVSDQYNWQIPKFVLNTDDLYFLDEAYIALRCIKAFNKSPRVVFLNPGGSIVLDEPIYLDGSMVAHSIDFAGHTNFQQWNVEGFAKQKRIAVFAHSFNESLHIKIFLDHYSQLTDPSDIYVIDHGSDTVKAKDVIPSDYGCQIIYLPKTPRDDFNIKQYCEYFQRFLLTQYEWVIHVDIDEMLVHEKGMKHLRDILFSQTQGVVFSPEFGVEILHHPTLDKELEGHLNICQQREYFSRNESYIKPAIASIPAYWGPGFHYCLNDFHTKTIPGLWLLHMKHISIKQMVDQRFIRQTNELSPQQLRTSKDTLAPQKIEGQEGIPYLDPKTGEYKVENRAQFELRIRGEIENLLIGAEKIPEWLRTAI